MCKTNRCPFYHAYKTSSREFKLHGQSILPLIKNSFSMQVDKSRHGLISFFNVINKDCLLSLKAALRLKEIPGTVNDQLVRTP